MSSLFKIKSQCFPLFKRFNTLRINVAWFWMMKLALELLSLNWEYALWTWIRMQWLQITSSVWREYTTICKIALTWQLKPLRKSHIVQEWEQALNVEEGGNASLLECFIHSDQGVREWNQGREVGGNITDYHWEKPAWAH